MHEQAERTDQAEQHEAERDDVMRQLRKHKAEEIQRDHGVELALTMLPRAEGVGNLHRAQLAVCGGDDVEQDLEALRREVWRQLLEAVAADREEAAHGIGD